MKRVAILQSCYIPWKGYFDMIASVDEFIFYDDMQYTRRDWRNRNTIKTANGPLWLTVPVQVKGRFDQKIRDTRIDGTDWIERHWKTITQNYKRAPFFDEIEAFLKPLYFDHSYETISDLNHEITGSICTKLGISTTLSRSWDYTLIDGKTERLIDLCIQSGATEYTSGPAARDYIDEGLFREAGIKLTWFDYSGYASYPQLWGEFQHSVSIIDLLFNCGDRSPDYMKHVRTSVKI